MQRTQGISGYLSLSLFLVTTFLSAFLLFQVQPLIAKHILPWFGGAPGVWTVCMLFFQVLLIGGYAYAHLLVPGGTVHLKTDSQMFFDFTRVSVTDRGGRILVAVDDIHGNDKGRAGAAHVVSAYEKAARERGETIKYMAFNLN